MLALRLEMAGLSLRLVMAAMLTLVPLSDETVQIVLQVDAVVLVVAGCFGTR